MKVKVRFTKSLKCYSVVDAENGWTIMRADTVLLKDAKFKVDRVGRARALKGKSNDHAYVVGELVHTDKRINLSGFVPARYSLGEDAFFVNTLGEPVKGAETVFCAPDGAYLSSDKVVD